MASNLPILAGTHIEEAWAGMIDAPPDFVPVMDEISSYKNLFLASGFSGHGFWETVRVPEKLWQIWFKEANRFRSWPISILSIQ
ncbi:MAG: hypothetical protein CM1200mP36_05430 [Gammaproteobacteria bacterium]|nr:MAG: hypothetical protein CM1200mP36_05430 [Gammaproteobacteria bacterium]